MRSWIALQQQIHSSERAFAPSKVHLKICQKQEEKQTLPVQGKRFSPWHETVILSDQAQNSKGQSYTLGPEELILPWAGGCIAFALTSPFP